MSDTESIGACTSSLIEVYTDNHSTLIGFAKRLNSGSNKRLENSEDIVQDAFFRLSSTPQVTSSPKAQLSYLYQIIRNLSIDDFRKQTLIGKYFVPEEVTDDMAVEPASPEEQCCDRQTLNLISNALSELPERTRYAFERHRVYGLAQKDVAKELGISNTLVNFMIRDALAHCRKRVPYMSRAA